jgi:hypothetical protein
MDEAAARERMARWLPPTMGAADSIARVEADVVLRGCAPDEIRAALERHFP